MKRPLNFHYEFTRGWDFSYIDKTPSGLPYVDIPHTIRLLPFHDFDERKIQGDSTYFLTFHQKKEKRRYILHFDGAMVQMDVYLNGIDLGHHVSGYLPVDIDVTEALKDGKNRLVIRLNGDEDPLVPPFAGVVDYQTFAGIYRPVYLIDKPLKEEIKDVYVRGRRNGDIDVFVEVDEGVNIHNEIYYKGEKIGEFDGTKGHLDDVALYSPSTPNLYHLVTRTSTDEVASTFAFMDVKWKEDGFYLNGKKLFLLGLNRHQTYPYIGAAATASLQKDDARILKELGINVVRTSHYPQSEDFLSECDRLGLFVIDEIPGWQSISKDPLWRARCVEFTEKMVIKERRHPCIIAYGVRIDESQDDHELYSKTNEVAHKLDGERATIGVRYFKDSECLEDIFGYNDFSCEMPLHGVDKPSSWGGAKGKAKLITEHSGHTYPTKSFDCPKVRETQALRHALIVDQAMGDPSCAGVIGWCAFDYATHKQFGSSDHICYHGVNDIFRQPKWAGYFYASQGDVPFLGVASSFQASEYENGRLPSIYVFTNADYIEVFLDGGLIDRFYPNKKKYPNLKHPPIVVDYFVGQNFYEPELSKNESKMMVKFLQGEPERGVEGMSLATKLAMFGMLQRHHLKPDYVYGLYYKYVGIWGGLTERKIVVRAYKDGECFDEKTFGTPQTSYLVATPKSEVLINGDTYDTTSILVERIDEYGNPCPYSSDELVVSLSGPIALLSPKVTSLVGGHVLLYVRSLEVDKPTPAKVKITHRDGVIEIPLTVE